MTAVALQCKIANHHPEWSNVSFSDFSLSGVEVVSSYPGELLSVLTHFGQRKKTYNTTYIRWTTHHPRGLSSLDLRLARKCDEIAAEMGLKDDDPDQQHAASKGADAGADSKLQGLACTVASSAGDCCTPKKQA